MDGEIRVELDRIHDEDKRQNKRLDDLEKSQGDIRDLVVTVKELAISSNYTNQKLDKVEQDVEQIKAAPAKAVADAKSQVWRTVVTVLITALVMGALWLITNHGGI